MYAPANTIAETQARTLPRGPDANPRSRKNPEPRPINLKTMGTLMAEVAPPMTSAVADSGVNCIKRMPPRPYGLTRKSKGCLISVGNVGYRRVPTDPQG